MFQAGMKKFLMSRFDDITSIEELAGNLLDLPTKEANNLFFFFGAYRDDTHPYQQLAKELIRHKEGTKAYAKVVAKAIDLCIQRYDDGIFIYD